MSKKHWLKTKYTAPNLWSYDSIYSIFNRSMDHTSNRCKPNPSNYLKYMLILHILYNFLSSSSPHQQSIDLALGQLVTLLCQILKPLLHITFIMIKVSIFLMLRIFFLSWLWNKIIYHPSEYGPLNHVNYPKELQFR